MAACLGVLPGMAGAGAWTQAPGAGIFIASISRKAAPIASFAGSPAENDSNYAALFFEYGLAEGLTAGGTAYVELSTMEDDGDTAELGIFLRQRLWQGEAGDVASVQIGLKQPVNDLLGGDFGGPNADPTQEVSVRALYGRGFGFDWGTAFVSLEAGYHLQTDGDEDEMRADLTGGVQPWDCCMVLLSLYSTYPIGDDDTASVKLAPSLTYRLGSGDAEPVRKPVTLQIGLSRDLLDPGDGLGVQVSIWKPF